MEFDINKVYTAASAEQVEIGSKVYVSSSLANLRQLVQDEHEKPRLLREVLSDKRPFRFLTTSDKTKNGWGLCYLVEPPAKDICTNRELAMWLMQGNGEYLFCDSGSVYACFYYERDKENDPVDVTIYQSSQVGRP